MKRLTTLLIICAVFCIVTLSYAASVLTQKQMSVVLGAAECERCIPPGAWTGPSPSCTGQQCSTHTDCPSTVQTRTGGYCSGTNKYYDCDGSHGTYLGRTVYCKCTNGQCQGGYHYQLWNMGPDCSETQRGSTCS
ncbi:TPA: hypothetical protein EYP66_13370 [Candidatus Poribacteria bacterium]|nr:hypothetical protein [Candidatus Poribacteria bacterium]